MPCGFGAKGNDIGEVRVGQNEGDGDERGRGAAGGIRVQWGGGKILPLAIAECQQRGRGEKGETGRRGNQKAQEEADSLPLGNV